jgi:hypothetical protein
MTVGELVNCKSGLRVGPTITKLFPAARNGSSINCNNAANNLVPLEFNRNVWKDNLPALGTSMSEGEEIVAGWMRIGLHH